MMAGEYNLTSWELNWNYKTHNLKDLKEEVHAEDLLEEVHGKDLLEEVYAKNLLEEVHVDSHESELRM